MHNKIEEIYGKKLDIPIGSIILSYQGYQGCTKKSFTCLDQKLKICSKWNQLKSVKNYFTHCYGVSIADVEGVDWVTLT